MGRRPLGRVGPGGPGGAGGALRAGLAGRAPRRRHAAGLDRAGARGRVHVHAAAGGRGGGPHGRTGGRCASPIGWWTRWPSARARAVRCRPTPRPPGWSSCGRSAGRGGSRRPGWWAVVPQAPVTQLSVASAARTTARTSRSAEHVAAGLERSRDDVQRAEQLGRHLAGGDLEDGRGDGGERRPVQLVGELAGVLAVGRGLGAAQVERTRGRRVLGEVDDAAHPVAQRDHRPCAGVRRPACRRRRRGTAARCCLSGGAARSMTGAVRRMQTRAPASTAGSAAACHSRLTEVSSASPRESALSSSTGSPTSRWSP